MVRRARAQDFSPLHGRDAGVEEGGHKAYPYSGLVAPFEKLGANGAMGLPHRWLGAVDADASGGQGVD